MPFIHIKSLPYEKSLDIPKIITVLCQDFSRDTGVALEHVHATWEYFQSGHYCKGDMTSEYQPTGPHSILVDLLTPDFFHAATVQKMLLSISGSLSFRAGIPRNKIFINHRAAHSGMVFDDGEIVHW